MIAGIFVVFETLTGGLNLFPIKY